MRIRIAMSNDNMRRRFGFLPPPIYGYDMGGNLAAKIKAIRMAMGHNQAEFADLLGTTQSTVTRWERGSMPKGEALQRLADIANTTVERLLNLDDITNEMPDQIPVVGYVGAGATILPIDDHPQGQGIDFVERPPFVSGKAVAVEVRGDSLFPVAENGWKLVYAGDQTVVEEEVLNSLCVCQLEDGRVLVKRVLRGTKPLHYHLQSTNAPLIEDARLVWAAKVKAIIPS